MPDAPPLLRVSEPRELLALIPHQLGFQPERSIVIVSLRERGRVGLVIRADLDDLADDDEDLAQALRVHLLRDQARQVLAVVYWPTDPRLRPDAQAALRTLRAVLAPDFGEISAQVVTDEGYMLSDDPAEPIRPLSDLDSTEVAATFTLSGSAPCAHRGDVARIPAAPCQDRSLAGAARRRSLAGPSDEAWRVAALGSWRKALAGTSTPAILGRIEAGLTDVRVRDAVLLSLLGADDAADESLCGESVSSEADAKVSGALGGLFGGGQRPPQDTRPWEVLTLVVSHGKSREQAPARTLLGFLSWWSGNLAEANLHLEAALRADPEYRLGNLLASAASAGVAPGWVRAQDALL